MKEMLSFEELQETFDIYGISLKVTDEIKEKCLDLCEVYNLSSEEIAIHWLGFAATNGYEEITLERLESFERGLLIKQKKSLVRETSPVQNEFLQKSKITISTEDDDLLAAYGASPATSTKKKNAVSVDSPQRSAKKIITSSSHSLDELKTSLLAPSLLQSPSTQQGYPQRTNSGMVVSSYGKSVEETSWKANFSYIPEVQVLPCGSDKPLSGPYNYMFEKLRDCGDVLDDAVYYLGNQIKESLKIEEISHLQSASNEAIWCIGRICCDSVGRLNAASVLLEGDRELCAGSTVKLDLSRLQKYSLFPGQIVAVKGINTTGSSLIAEEIVNGKALPLPQTSLTLGTDGVQIRVACGPFTTLENLMYEPLTDLLEDVVSNPPHVLILLGPLLEASHPSLEDPLLADSYDSILERCVKKIEASLKSTQTRVYIVASQRDVCCVPIYPTPSVFLLSSVTMNTEITFLSDPCLLDIDGITIGLTTLDLPMQISREEINCGHGSDRLSRLSQHLLLQQSFYPIFPPPENVYVNVEQADAHTRLPFTPHIMITPSDLKGYVKVVDECVFINPERLAKGKIGGSHCKIEIKLDRENKFCVNASILKI